MLLSGLDHDSVHEPFAPHIVDQDFGRYRCLVVFLQVVGERAVRAVQLGGLLLQRLRQKTHSVVCHLNGLDAFDDLL